MREEFDTPTTQDIRQWRLFLASQPKRSKDARRCFSGSENDWKRMIRSLENPGVYENPCGDLMLLALAHSLCVDIILFNMRRTSAPIYPVSSTVLGGQPSSWRCRRLSISGVPVFPFRKNLMVYCCVSQRLVTSDGPDGTLNDPGHPDIQWGWLSSRRLGGPQGLK